MKEPDSRKRGTASQSPGASRHRIVLIDSERAAARRNERVLCATGGRVCVLSDIAELDPSSEWQILVINFDTLLSENHQTLFALLRTTSRSKRVLLYASGSKRAELALLFGSQKLTNLLAKDPEVDGEELLITTQKLLGDDIFGLEKYFAWGTPITSCTATHSSQRAELIDAMHAFAIEHQTPTRLAALFAAVSDELITNAFFNSPVDLDGRPLFAHISRHEPVVLPEGKSVTIQFGSDGRRLGVAVSDPYGSLHVDNVLAHLARCMRKGDDQIDSKEGGAGLGLYFIFEGLSHFAVNLAPGCRTEMVGLIDVRGSYRDFTARGKAFNIFVQLAPEYR